MKRNREGRVGKWFRDGRKIGKVKGTGNGVDKIEERCE